MLAAHPDLNGVFCANDNMALGALRALKEADKPGKVTVVGYDNIGDVQPYLQSGEMYATVEQHPDLMGKYGARMAVGVLRRLRRSRSRIPQQSSPYGDQSHSRSSVCDGSS
jgi:ribose transport system substrate-binding protein